MELNNNTFKKNNLCVVTDCIHFSSNGRIGSNNTILIRQLDELFKYFNKITICCPFSNDDINNDIQFYEKTNIKFFFLKKLGGNSIQNKIELLLNIPKIIYQIHNASIDADFIYQRFPNNINLPGFFYTLFSNKKLFASYLGEWDGNKGSITYLIQKYLLRYFYKGPVFIYGFSNKKKFITTYSPSFYEVDWEEKKQIIKSKILKNKNWEKSDELIFLNVGRVEKNKNQLKAVNIIKKLKEQGYNPKLFIIGDIEPNFNLNHYVKENKLNKNVILLGRISFGDLQYYFNKAKFILQTPLYEGYGKVPIEGMVSGCVPLITKVGVSETIIRQSNSGILLKEDDNYNVSKIIALLNDIKKLNVMVINGRNYSKKLTIESWANDLQSQLKDFYKIENK